MSKILVVDDSYAELQMIEGYLKGASHTVVSYPNTEKLEDKVIAEKPDLIVLDVNLPRHNGDEVLRQIRSRKALSDTPVIMLTSSTSPADQAVAVGLGANLYIQKPSDLDELQTIGTLVRQLLKRPLGRS